MPDSALFFGSLTCTLFGKECVALDVPIRRQKLVDALVRPVADDRQDALDVIPRLQVRRLGRRHHRKVPGKTVRPGLRASKEPRLAALRDATKTTFRFPVVDLQSTIVAKRDNQ